MNESTRTRRNSISEAFFPSRRNLPSRTANHDNDGCNFRTVRSSSWSSILPTFFQKKCPSPNPITSISVPQDDSILESRNSVTDTRQGPLETDLFWLVLHDLSGSSK